MLQKNNKSYKISPSFYLSKKVKHICAPLFESGVINAFSYLKTYADGSETEIYSDPGVTHRTFFNKRCIKKSYIPNKYNTSDRYAFLEKKIKRPYKSQPTAQRNIFDHENCFAIIDKKDIDYEYFIFYTNPHTNSAINYYINNLNKLESFITEFKDKAKEIIKKTNLHSTEPCKEVAGNIRGLDRIDTTVLKTKKTVNLTNREIEVARHVVDGKTAKESAELLNISRRSIETHIDNIKNKFGCRKKIQLAVQLKSMQEW